jgi:(1->4)-alpha-D-glucan 1-alpha-D-glucosylmutase
MIASYRLQLHPEFTFEHVRNLIPYLRRLGISHLYLSPITEARRGSTHGYDVVDHNSVRADLGGREGFNALATAAHEAGLRIIIDFVPNHAGVGPRNRYWQDLLAYGPYSPHAKVFDVDWKPLKPELQNRILLPFLGRPYGEALDEGELGIGYDDGYFYATYYESRFALNPASYHDILALVLADLEREDVYFDVKPLVEAYGGVMPNERAKAEALRPRLQRIMEAVGSLDLTRIDHERLHHIFEQQFWRLSFWKTASSEINYRRFFDINELVALRMEEPAVFWDAHRLLSELLSLPAVDGVRIDHVDGLSDPHRYLDLLAELGVRHVWVEKIVAPGEILPEEWPVEGTTGYEFMNDMLGLVVDTEGQSTLDRTYRRAVSDALSFPEESYRSKKLVIETSLYSELFRLSYELDRLSEADYHTRDFTLGFLQEALSEIIAALDRYRTYLPHGLDEAREILNEAVYRALARNPAVEPTVYEFIRSIILGDVAEHLREAQQQWVVRFQQYCAPVAAKGVEDTAFYRYFRLAALNEVGGEPGHFGASLQAFHSRARFRALRYPRMLLATATHDHKRGEDTRMRLAALSEIPEKWEEAVRDFDTIALQHQSARPPSERDAYLFYQTALALWPGDDSSAETWASLADRIWPYMEKASRESKLETSWINPDAAYEEALESFIRSMLADEAFHTRLAEVAAEAARLGFRNSMTQLVLKLTTPGVPDVYQGTELPDFSLVDPDNRRPVDYDMRMEFLDTIDDALSDRTESPIRGWIDDDDGRAKFYVLARLLKLRRSAEDAFMGRYVECDIEGNDADRWLGFVREGETSRVVIAIRRHFSRPATDARLELPEPLRGSNLYDVLTGETVAVDGAIDLGSRSLPWMVAISQGAA